MVHADHTRTRAIELNPDDAGAIAGRSVTYGLMERYDEALADFNRAIELNPDDARNLYNQALIYQVLSRGDKARADLTAAIRRARQEYEKDPQDWINTFNLALYHLAAGEAEEAEHLYQEALTSKASPYYIREAVRDLDDFLTLFPDYPRARAMRDLLQDHLQATTS